MASLFEKIWSHHVVAAIDDATALIAIDRVFLHERTGSVALKSLAEAGRPVVDPGRVFATMDHIVSTRPGRGDATEMPGGTAFITETRDAARAAGINLFDVTDRDQGIVHVVSPELGIVLPGLTLVCPDSHTCTQGAMGALAWGIGSTEAEHALATGTLRVTKPKTMRVTVEGRLAPGVTAKDLALHLIARFGAAGGVDHAVEYAGEAVRALPMEARLTLCNMATEFGAFTGLIAPDAVTFDYLKGRRHAPAGAVWDAAVAQWQGLVSDNGSMFHVEHAISANEVVPMVSWGTSVQQSVAVDGRVPDDAATRSLEYMGLEAGQAVAGLPVTGAFIGSCTNSRLSDLERAAAIVRGRRVADGVRALVVPGSQAVKRAAEAAGLDRVFVEAGFEWRESGCSLCFYAGGESFGPRERVISSTNRNFESRQGPGTRTHIASPETVAASAIAGKIADARDYARG
ncbi:3-isopropylmalate dehydratase large subunit [Sandaracinobacteroides saxicola]|uniref:3-isopropylmalate dehydratase n=1 Tax=Sandaracinobacteroides saxicola TaxID=2759707 RepID=A0A7G5IJR2_9SPHN|nr:3-isopropylmalate dehydratase large subunit [Sandaracinobacteroides saxicola]QMW23604.1 3-isopropylmalate dehydratase large subunit [Sandaracinobacteroides saxicola]